jgi:hypothetical protein
MHVKDESGSGAGSFDAMVRCGEVRMTLEADPVLARCIINALTLNCYQQLLSLCAARNVFSYCDENQKVSCVPSPDGVAVSLPAHLDRGQTSPEQAP